MDKNVQDFEDVLTQLDEQRKQMEQAKQEAEQLRRATEDTKKKSDEYYAQIQKERAKATERAQMEAQHIIEDARRAADAVYQELAALRKQMRNPQNIPEFNARQSELRRKLNEAERATAVKTPEQSASKAVPRSTARRHCGASWARQQGDCSCHQQGRHLSAPGRYYEAHCQAG